jgi:hypothetical protein
MCHTRRQDKATSARARTRGRIGRSVTQHGQRALLKIIAPPPVTGPPRSGQPEGHLHGTVEVNSSGECRAGLLPLPGYGLEHAKAPVGLLARSGDLGNFWAITMGGNRAEEAHGRRLALPFLIRTSNGARLLDVAGEPRDLTSGEAAARVPKPSPWSRGLVQGRRAQWHGRRCPQLWCDVRPWCSCDRFPIHRDTLHCPSMHKR